GKRDRVVFADLIVGLDAQQRFGGKLVFRAAEGLIAPDTDPAKDIPLVVFDKLVARAEEPGQALVPGLETIGLEFAVHKVEVLFVRDRPVFGQLGGEAVLGFFAFRVGSAVDDIQVPPVFGILVVAVERGADVAVGRVALGTG